jgi:hypothetical protein
MVGGGGVSSGVQVGHMQSEAGMCIGPLTHTHRAYVRGHDKFVEGAPGDS